MLFRIKLSVEFEIGRRHGAVAALMCHSVAVKKKLGPKGKALLISLKFVISKPSQWLNPQGPFLQYYLLHSKIDLQGQFQVLHLDLRHHERKAAEAKVCTNQKCEGAIFCCRIQLTQPLRFLDVKVNHSPASVRSSQTCCLTFSSRHYSSFRYNLKHFVDRLMLSVPFLFFWLSRLYTVLFSPTTKISLNPTFFRFTGSHFNCLDLPSK